LQPDLVVSQLLQSLAVLHVMGCAFQYSKSAQRPGHAALVFVSFEPRLKKDGTPVATVTESTPNSVSAGLGASYPPYITALE